MDDYTPILIGLAVLVLLPWLVVAVAAFGYREHFRAYMPWYIGGAFAAEFFLIFVLLGGGMVM